MTEGTHDTKTTRSELLKGSLMIFYKLHGLGREPANTSFQFRSQFSFISNVHSKLWLPKN